MYDRRFFASQLGASALVSIAAMITFAIFAAGQAHGPAADIAFAAPPLVELA